MTEPRKPEGDQPQRDQPPGSDSDGFDPDVWFETQFGSRPPAASPPPAVPPVVAPALPPLTLPPAVPPVLPPAAFSREHFPPSALSGEDLPTQEVPASELMGDAATQLLRQPGPPGVGDAPIGGDVDGGALDDVFGADQFRDYSSEPMLRSSRSGPAPGPGPAPGSAFDPAAAAPVAPPTTMGPGAAGLARDTTAGLQVPGYYDIGERGDPLPRATSASAAASTAAAGAHLDAASGGEAGRASGVAAKGSGLTKNQRTLLWVLGGLLAVIALFALYLLGTRIPEWAAEPAPIVTEEPEPEAEPEPDPLEGVPDDVPLPEGDWAWELLRGGECLDPFESPWAEEFTVVDCAEPHAAQLIQRAEFPEATDEFPGVEAVAAPLSLICSSPEVLDFDAASAYDDVQVQTAYPVTPEEWAAGYREFFCFVTREEGEPLEGSLVGAGADGAADEG